MKNSTMFGLIIAVLILTGGGVAIVEGKEAIIQKLAEAFTFAEGGNRPGTRPFRNNNPGDLTLDIGGNDIHPLRFDGIYAVYATWDDGFNDLKQMIRGWFNGRSRIYSVTMSIRDIASHYTTTEVDTWANNVAHRLGVSPDTRLMDLL